jgi:hypothetical protein
MTKKIITEEGRDLAVKSCAKNNAGYYEAMIDVAYENNAFIAWPERLKKVEEKYGLAFKTMLQLDNYNSEVLDVGHVQYYDDGYASNGTPGSTGSKLHREMLNAFDEIVTSNVPDQFADTVRRARVIIDKFAVGIDNDECEDEADVLDEEWFKISDEFMKALDAVAKKIIFG